MPRGVARHRRGGEKRVAVTVFAAFLLSACAADGTGRYLLVTQTSHGPIIWYRYATPEACEQGRREDEQSRRQVGLVMDARCTTARDLRRRR
jgi:hypothetical protein